MKHRRGRGCRRGSQHMRKPTSRRLRLRRQQLMQPRPTPQPSSARYARPATQLLHQNSYPMPTEHEKAATQHLAGRSTASHPRDRKQRSTVDHSGSIHSHSSFPTSHDRPTHPLPVTNDPTRSQYSQDHLLEAFKPVARLLRGCRFAGIPPGSGCVRRCWRRDAGRPIRASVGSSWR